jgi:ribosomal small subunit protein bTHX
MGRGDRKTKKGKISIRSYGNVRPHAEKAVAGTRPTVAKNTPKPVVKKAVAPARKAPAKKAG